MRPDEIYEGDPEAVPDSTPLAPREEPAWRLPALFGLFVVLVLALILSFYMSPLQKEGAGASGERAAALATPTPVSGTIKVYVVGEVQKPGVVTLASDARVEDAVRAAGGMTQNADTLSVNLAARIKDEQQIIVRGKGEAPVALDPMADLPPPEEGASPEAGEASPGPAGDAAPVDGAAGTTETSTTVVEEDVMVAGGAPARKISLNQASAEELDANVKGLGPVLARAIVEYRQGRSFQTVDDLLNVPGIGPAKLEQIRPFVDL